MTRLPAFELLASAFPMVKSLIPDVLVNVSVVARKRLLGFLLRHLHRRHIAEVLNAHDLNVARLSDFYSTLPSVEALERTRSRWDRPSELVGVELDLDAMRSLTTRLIGGYHREFLEIGEYREIKGLGFGPGFPRIDCLILYAMVRDLKPSRIVEIGSGLSTFYASRAGDRNEEGGHGLQITSVDPFPREALYGIPRVTVRKEEAQDVELSAFEALEAGDLLSIDSTHVVKVGGEVPYLYLEVLPRLRKDVVLHIHDVHFPYNVPHPAEEYIFRWARTRWPVFWNEAMLVQAFLCFNEAFRIRLSLPFLRHRSEDFLPQAIPDYEPVRADDLSTHFGSIWIERVAAADPRTLSRQDERKTDEAPPADPPSGPPRPGPA